MYRRKSIMALLTGLFRFARKRTQTTDTDMGAFRDKITELVAQKDTLKDDEVVKRVEELKVMASDLPDTEDKDKLLRFIEDFGAVREQDPATAKEAASMVADLFEKLDTEAMKEVSEEIPAEPPATDEPPAGDGEPPAPDEQEKILPPDGKETGDQSPEENREYSLEEIWQFIKKRMAEDGCAPTKDEEQEQKDDEGITADHAPHIPVTMTGAPAAGSLGEMFNKIKEGRR
jgi:hypothetical protein